MIRPSRQQSLNHARRGALAHSDAAGDGDHIGNRCGKRAEKRVRRLAQSLRRGDVEIQQARQRQVDERDFFQGDPFVDAAEFREVVFRSGSAVSAPEVGPSLPC